MVSPFTVSAGELASEPADSFALAVAGVVTVQEVRLLAPPPPSLALDRF